MSNIKAPRLRAIILAAGAGMRLSSVSRNVPKGLTVVAGKTILERAIHSLIAKNIKKSKARIDKCFTNQ